MKPLVADITTTPSNDISEVDLQPAAKLFDLPTPTPTLPQYEILAYCSKNYQDALEFVLDSWTSIPSVSKVNLYTDWDYISKNSKVEVNHFFFDVSYSWIEGTGRRLDVIRDYSNLNKGKSKNVLFLDIDCYIAKDVGEIFNSDFDIAISRLGNKESYTQSTATAGLWFCKLSPGYFNFIADWFNTANDFKNKKIGLKDNKVSYVQYSFTDVARRNTKRYRVLPIDEYIYNSEHSDLDAWYKLIRKHHPKILHFKGRRFRDNEIIKKVFNLMRIPYDRG